MPSGTKRKQPIRKAKSNSVKVETEYTQTIDGIPNWGGYLKRFQEQFGNMPMQNINEALMRALPFSTAFSNNPYIQNTRFKKISSLPVNTTKQQIVEMLQSPNNNELGLRQVSNILEYTAYPMVKIRTTYQDLLTYHHYVRSAYTDKKDARKPEYLREWRLVDKIAFDMQIGRFARQVVGQTVRDGKVFYYPRLDVDKAHNAVRKSAMQQLPQDWTKIVGFNNVSKYTIAFNMFYFLQPGTTYLQFGDLFLPYVEDFNGVLNTPASPTDAKGVIYNGKSKVSSDKIRALQKRVENGSVAGSPEVYFQNGNWFYWVTLPVDQIWTFEIDDVKPNVVSPLTGLFLSMSALAQYEQVQLEIIQNPLVSMVLGTIETYDTPVPGEADPYKVSPSGQKYFEYLFNQLMAQNNTGGIGIYAAPYKDMNLVQLQEAPNATKISSAGYEYAMAKSGMSALTPTSSDARAGVAQISLKLEGRYPQHIYGQIERMMNKIYENLNLKHEWRFTMFGDVATDDALMKQMEKSMTLGILPDVYIYNALLGRSVLDDLSMSYAIDGTDLLQLRKPLISSFSAKSTDGNLPPQSEGGRPSNEGDVTTGGGEADVDDATGANEI